tara:strand:+ start:420 stop:671 length:252 start_codon:yes stop_codon:yes gene_type:complete
MNKYYCPYCNIAFKFPKDAKKEELICLRCGDILLKNKFLSFKRSIALIAFLSFVLPMFIIYGYSLIYEFKKQNNIEVKFSLVN